MFGRSQPYGQIAELQRKVGSLHVLGDERCRRRQHARCRPTRTRLRNARILDDVAERFRNGADRFGKEATRLGHRATELGEISVDRIAKEVGLHPFMVVGIAVGLGAIIGAARYRYALQNPKPPRRPRQIRKGRRK